MRHGDKQNQLGRKKGHRDALLKNMSNSLILHKRIHTTLAKAKALRKYIEPLLTKTKTNTTHSRRVIFSYLQNKEVLKELFGTVADKIANRPGGYVRIIKTGFRKGDGAETAMIELVDFNELLLPGGAETEQKGKRRRTRRSGAKTATTTTTTETVTTTATNVVEDVKDTVADAADEVKPTE